MVEGSDRIGGKGLTCFKRNEQRATCNNERTQGVKGNGRGGGFAAVGWSVPVPDSRSREHGKDERDTILS